MASGSGAVWSSEGKWAVAVGHEALLERVAVQTPKGCRKGPWVELHPPSAAVPYGLSKAVATHAWEEAPGLSGSPEIQVT